MGRSQRQKMADQIQREELADELRKIIRHAKRIKDDKWNLRGCYVKWHRSSGETIEALTELKDNVLAANTVANAATSIGNLTEIFGGILSIAGAIADQRDLMETGNKITKGGNVFNVGTAAIKGVYLQEVCSKATKHFRDNEKCSKEFEQQRYSYFQQLESFKRELNSSEVSSSFPLLLETAQREGIDFLGDLGLDDDSRSNLRTNLRQMCRSNSKKLRATSQMVRAHDVGRVFASEIRRLLLELKRLLDEDKFLSSVFSQQTRKFLGENIGDLVCYSDAIQTHLARFSGMGLLQAGVSVMRTSGFASASRTQVGIISGVSVMLSMGDLIKRISDINNGSKSQESEDLEERIEEMKEMREIIIEEMRKIFGCQEPHRVTYSYPSLEYR